MSFFRHPLVNRVSSTFILCGCSDVTSQLFLNTPVSVDPDRVIRFSLSGSFSLIPIWFGWNSLVSSHLSNGPVGLAKRIAMEAFLFGPLYLSSLLFWTTTIKSQNPVQGLQSIPHSLLPLYLDALKIVPAYNAFTYFAVAPHMRGYALTGFQYLWNIYVAWYVDNASDKFSPPPTSLMYSAENSSS